MKAPPVLWQGTSEPLRCPQNTPPQAQVGAPLPPGLGPWRLGADPPPGKATSRGAWDSPTPGTCTPRGPSPEGLQRLLLSAVTARRERRACHPLAARKAPGDSLTAQQPLSHGDTHIWSPQATRRWSRSLPGWGLPVGTEGAPSPSPSSSSSPAKRSPGVHLPWGAGPPLLILLQMSGAQGPSTRFRPHVAGTL